MSGVKNRRGPGIDSKGSKEDSIQEEENAAKRTERTGNSGASVGGVFRRQEKRFE